MSGVANFLFGGNDAAKATKQAAQISADSQRDVLQYLKQVGQPAFDAQKFGLQGLTNYYSGDQNQLIQDVQSSPFYDAMIQSGDEAVLRNLQATGNARGGVAPLMLAQNSQNVLQNLVNQRLQGLGGLAQIPTNTNQVAQTMGNIGAIQAQGITGAAQAKQQALGNLYNTGIGLAGIFG